MTGVATIPGHPTTVYTQREYFRSKEIYKLARKERAANA